MERIEFRILGSAELTGGDGSSALSVLAQPKRIALLTYLSLNALGSFVRRDLVCAALWPDADQSQARHRLRTALHMLRQAIGGETLERRGDEEVALAASRFWCDVVAFEEAAAAGDHERALSLYRGEFLEGFHVEASNDFEDWVTATRDRLRRQAGASAAALAEIANADAEFERAAAYADRALELEPFDEEGLRQQLIALDGLGRRSDAVRAYDAFAERLMAELSTRPSPETDAILSRVDTRREPVPVAATLTSDASDPAPAAGGPSRSARTAGLTAALAFAGAAFFAARVAQAGPDTTAQPGGVSLLAYLASWLTLVVGVWFLFERAEETASDEGRVRVAAWLRPRLRARVRSVDAAEDAEIARGWAEGFVGAFDRIFGPHHLSLYCFLRSMAVSVIAVTVLLLLWIGLRPEQFSEFASGRGLTGMGELVLITFIVNVVADYLSLLETRGALALVRRWRSSAARAAVLGVDALATFAIWLAFYAGLPFLPLAGVSGTASDIMLFIQFQLWGYAPTIYEVVTLSARDGGPPVGIWFYSTFVTSIWIWLYLGAGGLARATRSAGDTARSGLRGVASLFDAEAQPFRVLGFAAMVLVTAAYVVGLALRAL